ncbi:hypothetical protein DM2_290 [Halorubrum sp. DM2]|uniref:hypothetical protein n=1 Tax=unclassified Halorubrum TaxID=2642239 RepID=UPI0003DD66F1|nr:MULTISPECIES: hypothetical protein [unclassified Halorubrum]CDK40145.1 hypothetical protein BN903_54 [Halorubrum sp. AJ67]VTT85408.1 hypothetical protein DM2_290 [Halorubrum sp. DM2]
MIPLSDTSSRSNCAFDAPSDEHVRKRLCGLVDDLADDGLVESDATGGDVVVSLRR